MTPRLDPRKRLRQHPEDPEVWEYTVSYVRTVFPAMPCRGCMHHNGGDCSNSYSNSGALDKCKDDTVWYGEHIEVANKLEGLS